MLFGQILGQLMSRRVPLIRRSATIVQSISHTLPSDQTAVGPLSRPSRDSSVSQTMYFGLHHATSVDQNGLIRAV